MDGRNEVEGMGSRGGSWMVGSKVSIDYIFQKRYECVVLQVSSVWSSACFLSNRTDGVQTAISLHTFRIEGVLEVNHNASFHG